MTNPQSAAVSAAVRAPASPLTLLRDLIDEDRWVGLGWDPVTHILSPDQAHPTLGHPVCQADGCGLEATSRSGLCSGCQRDWSRSAMSDLEAFKGVGVQRPRRTASRRGELCRVCRVPGRERPSKSRGLCGECAKRARARGQSVEDFIAGDARFAAASPRRGYGRCRVASCPAWAATAAGLCRGHGRRWAQGGRLSGQAFERWCGVEAPCQLERTGTFNLSGLHERVRLEVLYGLQVAIEESRNIRGSAVSRTVDVARQSGAETLLDLADHGYAHARHGGAVFLRFTIARLQTALADPETEAVKDVWNLRVFGFPGALDFSPLTQPWLRETAKHWALVMRRYAAKWGERPRIDTVR